MSAAVSSSFNPLQPSVLTGEDDHYDTVVQPTDLDVDLLSTDDLLFIREFESKWAQFIDERPDLMPRGGQTARMAVLNQQVEHVVAAKKNAEQELQSQLAFFLGSRDALEETYATEVEYANKVKTVIQERLETQLADVNTSFRLAHETMPWGAFMEAVDHRALSSLGRSSLKSMSLITDCTSSDARLRALQLDHALLTAQLKMMEKESTRLDLHNQSLEFASKFLMEFNVWGMMTKPQDAEGGGGINKKSSISPQPKKPRSKEPDGVKV